MRMNTHQLLFVGFSTIVAQFFVNVTCAYLTSCFAHGTLSQTIQVHAEYVSMLFFCVMDLATIDPMYQYSLSYFISLFLRSIHDSPKSKDVTIRLASLKEHFSFFLFTNVCRSLFDRHKLLFAFKLALVQEPVPAALLNFLLTGGISMENAHQNPLEGVMSEKCWGEVCRLNDIGGRYKGLRESVSSESSTWQG